jgi:hypothetical protein
MIEIKEKIVLREFQRRAHHYISTTPSISDKLEWLALIQHHGGVTRLLDFSHSFYVAAFFAAENTHGDFTNAAVWAINLSKIHNTVKDKIDESKKGIFDGSEKEFLNLAENILREVVDNNLVFGVEPEKMNERLAIQQGIFLFPCNVRESLEQNLAGTFDEQSEVFQKTAAVTYNPEILTSEILKPLFEQTTVIKIIIPSYIRDEILRDLWKMNVSTATLFPGIDGFTRSLNFHLLSNG